MSLNSEQRAATIREFQENMSRLGLTAERRQGFWRQRQQSGANHHPQVGRAGVSVDYPSLSAEQAETQGVELTPFMALRGNPHDYWFLDGDSIDRGEID